ncbi:MAG: hypothetical protein SFU85_02360 [Candidatus Methylacidiphilales bacterium]|nr:hypothetical protein [Candidatus Methylacidiphilales bacterium]
MTTVLPTYRTSTSGPWIAVATPTEISGKKLDRQWSLRVTDEKAAQTKTFPTLDTVVFVILAVTVAVYVVCGLVMARLRSERRTGAYRIALASALLERFDSSDQNLETRIQGLLEASDLWPALKAAESDKNAGISTQKTCLALTALTKQYLLSQGDASLTTRTAHQCAPTEPQ